MSRKHNAPAQVKGKPAEAGAKKNEYEQDTPRKDVSRARARARERERRRARRARLDSAVYALGEVDRIDGRLKAQEAVGRAFLTEDVERIRSGQRTTISSRRLARGVRELLVAAEDRRQVPDRVLEALAAADEAVAAWAGLEGA